MSNDDPILRALCKGFVLAEAYSDEADCKLFHEAERLYRAAARRSCGFPDCTCPPNSAGDVHCPRGVAYERMNTEQPRDYLLAVAIGGDVVCL